MNLLFVRKFASSTVAVALLASVFAGFPFSTALAADTGLLSVSATRAPSNWGEGSLGDAGNAFSSNDSYAQNDDEAEEQGWGDLNFPAIPAGSTINGIEVKVEAKSSDSSGCELQVELDWDGGTNGTSDKTTALTGSDTVYTLGGANDTWGRTWAPSEFTNANFVIMAEYDDTSGNNCTGNVSVDHIQAKVYYTEAAPEDPNDSAYLAITCDNVDISGTTWTMTGTWKAYNFPGQSTQYDVAAFAPSGTTIDTSSKDNPDIFATTQGPSNYVGTNPNKQDMEGTWTNIHTFLSAPTYLAATLYHAAVPGNEQSGDSVCTFVLPQCADGVDNADAEDSLVDANDPGCWTDPNNSNTYNPEDNDETNPTDVCPNDAGIQTDPNQCTADACTNIPEFQATVPAGYETLTPGICTVIPECRDDVDNTDAEDSLIDENDPGCWTDPNNPNTYNSNDTDETTPTDVCLNDTGIQTSTDQCTPDACTNIADFQATVPAGYETLSPGICTLIPECRDDIDNADNEDSLVDENDPGCWTDPNNPNTYNSNDTDETTPTDVCPNDQGIQTNENQCTVDACSNIAEFQATVPVGYETLTPGICTVIPECRDGVDNDDSEDSLVDENDPGCESADDTDETDPAPQYATVHVAKVVCDSEADLPNWGDGGPTITSTTASSFVSESEGACELAEWEFQWAPGDASNPGDNVTEAGEPWTTFTNSIQLPNPDGATFWFREVLPDGWLPFSTDTTPPADDQPGAVSAEFYCDSDVLNYDNFDYISGVDAGEDFYCVGFNVAENPPAPECSDGVDNEGDEQTDANDPGCWSDPQNPESYNPLDDNESDEPTSCEQGYHEETVTPEQESPFAPNVCSEGTYVEGQCVLSAPPFCGDTGIYNPETDLCELPALPPLPDLPPPPEVPLEEITLNEGEQLFSVVLIDGVPPQCPEGMSLNPATDMCEGIGPAPVCPEGAPYDEGSQLCVPPAPESEVQCVPDSAPADVCPNIDGFQESMPRNYKHNDDGSCVKQGRSGGNSEPGGSSGSVLGATTSAECGPLLSDYLFIGWDNDEEQVKKLQDFLNTNLGLSLVVSGLFGPETLQAVKDFQVKYGTEVLSPWVGLPGSGIDNNGDPTGFVYQTTRWQINNLFCPGSEAFPETLI